jgi:signal transduction histidine kinase/CheY-like chemotaxis protein
MNITVLIGDSNPSDLLSIEKTLRAENIRAYFASTGSEIIEKALHTLPDIILLGTCQSDINELQVIDRLRKVNQTAAIPVVLASRECGQDFKSRYPRVQVDGFVSYPYHPAEICAFVKNYFQSPLQPEGTTNPFKTSLKIFVEEKNPEDGLLSAGREESRTLLEQHMGLINRFLQPGEFQSRVYKILAEVGAAAQVERASVFENQPDPNSGRVLMQQRFQWTKQNSRPTGPLALRVAYYPVFSKMYDAFMLGKPFAGTIRYSTSVENQPPSFQDVVSILNVPIQVQEQLWGFIGFEDANVKRTWALSDLSLLTTIAAHIGKAIERERFEKTIRDSESRLRVILNRINAGVIVSQAKTKQIIDANAAAIQLIGAPKEDVFRARRDHFIIPGISEPDREAEPALSSNHNECFLSTSSGKRISIINNSVVQAIENEEFIIDTFVDIEERKQIEAIESEQRMLAEALRGTANALNQSLKLSEVLELILNNIGNVVPHDAANIMLIENGMARMTAVSGYEKIRVNKETLLQQQRPVESVPNMVRMIQRGEAIVVPDTHFSPDWVQFETSYWIRSYMSAPIRHKDKTIGFLNLNSSIPGYYNKKYAERLCAFADQAAIAIANATLYEEAQQELARRNQVEEELQKAMNELETRVERRTAELRSTNEQLKLELYRRKQAEQALEEERASLAVRVEERTSELSSANAELAKAARLKDAFLANMSHELRTPLNAILNVSETLQEQVYGPMNDAQLHSIRTVEESSNHLLSLINDILDLSKIGAGKFELVMDLVPVNALCQSSLKLIEESANKKKVTVNQAFDPEVKVFWGDLRRLKQVLVNLLSNAVKFTPQGGEIGLTVTGDREHKLIRFTVWDTGIGIPENSIRNLFKPFVQLDNSLSRQYEGTGLGLALAYHIVELHGGGVRVESEVGKGSRFTITLNWEEEEEEFPGGTAGSSDGKNANVDVEAGPSASIPGIKRILSEFGIDTINLWLEKETPERIAEILPDIIVLDMEIKPEIQDFIQRLRADSQIKDIPVIAVSYAANRLNPEALPPKVEYIEIPLSRQQFRKVLKVSSIKGTASLVRKAVLLFDAKPTRETKDQPLLLLVDDNELTVHTLRDYLISKGYRVVFAHSGTEAVERARELKPSLILMDIQMPGMDGIETTRRSRADAKLKHIPVIALTALAMPSDRSRCMEAGANEYLSKPLSLKILIEMIEAQLRQASLLKPALESD